MAKRKSIHKIIKNDIYPFDVLVSINETDKKFKKALAKYGMEHLNEEAVDIQHSTRKGTCITCLKTNRTIIRIRDEINTPEDYATLSHEVFHAVVGILEIVGIKFSYDSEEAYAYLIGYYIKEILELKEG